MQEILASTNSTLSLENEYFVHATKIPWI